MAKSGWKARPSRPRSPPAAIRSRRSTNGRSCSAAVGVDHADHAVALVHEQAPAAIAGRGQPDRVAQAVGHQLQPQPIRPAVERRHGRSGLARSGRRRRAGRRCARSTARAWQAPCRRQSAPAPAGGTPPDDVVPDSRCGDYPAHPASVAPAHGAPAGPSPERNGSGRVAGRPMTTTRSRPLRTQQSTPADPGAARPATAPEPDQGARRPTNRVRTRSARAAAIVIERIEPELDGGRHAVKRVVGDDLLVTADIYADGHDLLDAALLLRVESGSGARGGWRESAMRLVDERSLVRQHPARPQRAASLRHRGVARRASAACAAPC